MNDKDAPAKAEASAFVEVPRSVIAQPGQLLQILDETTQTKRYAPANTEAYCFVEVPRIELGSNETKQRLLRVQSL